MVKFPVANPFLEWLGISFSAWSPGYAEIHLPVMREQSNRTGRVHGGVICTLLDSVCGYSGLYAAEGDPALTSVTLSLTTNFIDSGAGETLVAKGHLERKGRSIYFARGELWLDDALLLATAVGTFKYIASR